MVHNDTGIIRVNLELLLLIPDTQSKMEDLYGGFFESNEGTVR